MILLLAVRPDNFRLVLRQINYRRQKTDFSLPIFFDKLCIYWKLRQYCKVWKNEKFSLTKIFFREINSSNICIKTLLSRNFCQKSVGDPRICVISAMWYKDIWNVIFCTSKLVFKKLHKFTFYNFTILLPCELISRNNFQVGV